jgi:hypothetical protein
MGVDVYTPCYNAMTESCGEWHELQREFNDWESRETVETQDWTEQDHADYDRISSAIHQMELKAGHFRHRSPFCSSLAQMVRFEVGDDCGTVLSHDEVGYYLGEWRAYLRSQVAQFKHLEEYVNGFHEPVSSPFDGAVRRFKNWCQVYRLGEGCYIG